MSVSPFTRTHLARAVAIALVATAAAVIPILSTSAASGSPVAAVAVPKLPKLDATQKLGSPARVLRQPGGYAFRAVMSPATSGSLFETLAGGFSVARDQQGAWHYVTGRNARGHVVLSQAVVSRAPAPNGLARHAGRTPTKVNKDELAIRTSIENQLELAALEAQRVGVTAAHPRVFRVPALMLATNWDESKGQNSPQFQKGHDATYFKKVLDGFGGNPRGSVTQFYYEASFGQFLVKVDVFGPYTSAISYTDRCYYGTPDDGGLSVTNPLGSVLGVGGGGALGMALEAVPQADVDPAVNWSKYDNDGDGLVDFTIIIHSGADHAATLNPCDTHSHALQVTSIPTGVVSSLGVPIPDDLLKVGIPTSSPGVFVDRIVTIPEQESVVEPVTIGVAAHEMAHALGEPDYYDTTYSSTGTGDFDVMSGGSYTGTPSGSNPTTFNPATRVFQGWLTPTIVHGDLRHYTLHPRTVLPRKGYHVGQPDPNLLLVPTYEVKQGQKDKTGKTWGPNDVYGLAKDPKTGKYVVEGYYVENVSRTVHSVKLHKGNPMGSIFDRGSHGNGLIVWHFDYYKESSTYFGHANDAQTDPNRYQMDVEEFDQNDNTQELQLNLDRANAGDYLVGAATGITSGTRLLPPHSPRITGKPQKPVAISGASSPVQPGTAPFVVEKNPANLSMIVSINSTLVGDCKLSLTDPSGHTGTEVDSGSVGDAETISVQKPMAGKWIANVGDYAACGQWTGTVKFEGPQGKLDTFGSADTWSNWSAKPTGWAFTNVSGYGNGLDMSPANENGNITLDVLNLSRSVDVSPGFVTGKLNAEGGQAPISAGTSNALQVPVFSNGGKAAGKVKVVVHEGSATGKVVATKTVKLAGYQRKNLSFSYRPDHEGPVQLVTVVDPADRIKEGSEHNQAQVTNLQVGPANPKVLIVDDDGAWSHERAIAGDLAALGVPYAVTYTHPTAADLKKYAAVIWETSLNRAEGVFNKADRRAVVAYLNKGGNMLLTGNRVMGATATVPSPQSSASSVSMAAHYFGIRIPEGNQSYVITRSGVATVTGSGLLGGQKIRLTPEPARPFLDLAGLTQAGTGYLGTKIKAFGKAFGLGRLDHVSMEAVQPAGDPAYSMVGVDGDAKHRGFKTVISGFNLGDVERSDVAVSALKAVLQHFGVPLHTYQPAKNGALIYTTPVRDQTSGTKTVVTAVVLGTKATPKLFYRRHGSHGFYSVAMSRGSVAGTWVATIPGNAATPDGIDYYIAAGGVTAPYGGGGRPLYASIAGAMPTVKHPLKNKH